MNYILLCKDTKFVAILWLTCGYFVAILVNFNKSYLLNHFQNVLYFSDLYNNIKFSEINSDRANPSLSAISRNYQ